MAEHSEYEEIDGSDEQPTQASEQPRYYNGDSGRVRYFRRDGELVQEKQTTLNPNN